MVRFTKKENEEINRVVKSLMKDSKFPKEVKIWKTYLKTVGKPVLLIDKKTKKLVKKWDEAERRYKKMKKVV
jgi:hypothetical protein